MTTQVFREGSTVGVKVTSIVDFRSYSYKGSDGPVFGIPTSFTPDGVRVFLGGLRLPKVQGQPNGVDYTFVSGGLTFNDPVNPNDDIAIDVLQA